MIFTFLWSKFIKKLPLSSIRNCNFEKPSKVEARSTVYNTTMGRYSYCGYNCVLINCSVGRFCSIADNVVIGLSEHPIDWVSTSCAFYYGKDSIPKDLANLDYKTTSKKTVIENDVWIGEGVHIKAGVKIGNGAIIGMGSVVTKDVLPYSIVAGSPASIIKMRFKDDIVDKLIESNWWDMSIDKLKACSRYFDDPVKFLEYMEINK